MCYNKFTPKHLLHRTDISFNNSVPNFALFSVNLHFQAVTGSSSGLLLLNILSLLAADVTEAEEVAEAAELD